MRTTIDSAGRIVVPKSLRDAMGLGPGQQIDIVFTDGRLEIEFAPAEVTVDLTDGLPRLVGDPALPPLEDTDVREALEATRR